MDEARTYSNPPLVLAVVEVKHPTAEFSLGQAHAMRAKLRPELPFHREDDLVTQTLEMGPAGGRTSTSTAHVHYFESRTRRTRLACGREFTSIETTEYDGWTKLVSMLRAGLDARSEISEIDGVSRVGVRYIDEVRVPDDDAPNWAEWIAPSFVAPSPAGRGLRPIQQNCVVQYGTSEQGVLVTARYGAVEGGPAVAGDMRPDAPAPGHYFLLDTDVAWDVPPGTAVPEFDLEFIQDRFDLLHGYAGGIFESLLTPRLREEVLR